MEDFFFFLKVCCLCRKCDQCGRWSRQKAITRDDLRRDRELAENRREFDEIRQQHDAIRDQLRMKYNLNVANSDIRVTP